MAVYSPNDFSKVIATELKKMAPTDEYFTYRMSDQQFILVNNDEMKQSMKVWKKLKCDCLKFNSRNYEINGKTFYGFVIQPKDLEEAPISIMGLSLDAVGGGVMMVSGFLYLSKKESNRDAIWKYLGSKIDTDDDDCCEEAKKIMREIKDEMKWVDVKPYSHNIISCGLKMLSEFKTKPEMEAFIVKTGLRKMGW